MSEIKNESFSIGDRFRGLVNGEILVVEALPKKGDEDVYKRQDRKSVQYLLKDISRIV